MNYSLKRENNILSGDYDAIYRSFV